MAVQSIAVPPDPKRVARALELIDQVGTWPRFILKESWGSFEAGTVFRRAPSSRDPKVRYLVNSVACQCPDYAEAGFVCKHIRAYARWEQRQARGVASEAETDLIFAEVGTRLRGDQAGAAVTTFGTCVSKSGCDLPAGGRSRLCGRHLDALLDQLGA